MKKIITDRLFLREMNPEDYDALFRVLGDPETMWHYPYTFDGQHVRDWIERNMNRYRKDGFGLWAVCLKDTGKMIGDCGLTLQNINGETLPEIGFHIRRDCQRKGYAKEAARAVRDWAFRNTEYPALYSYCKYTNVPSYRTAESIGMRFVCEYPDEINGKTHVSAITREEWLREINKNTRHSPESSKRDYAGKTERGEQMKILVLNGSPKKKSDTFRLTDAFLKGLNRVGEHEVHIVNVIDKKIAPCRGCFGCWQRGDGHCVIPDDQNAILDVYRDADVIIWSFPLYCYGMPSHLKAVLDRTIPLVKMKMVRQPDGTVRHEALADFSRIHTVVICGCGFPHWEGNFDGLKQMCKTCFGNPEMICVPETPMLNVPAAAIVADPLLKRFEEAGAEYAANLRLSAETVEKLETPMISAEDYIRNVNGV